ncbi:MAG: glycosyltransferase family 4 protein [Bacteroidia bacterium]|nr:glycosyltransferase family 4 protein [Bacteroidia bacterium]
MLRILQICNKAPYPANDGSSIAIHNMAKGLLANGVQLHLLCINTKKHFKPDEGVPEDFKKSSHYASVYRNTNTSLFGAFLNIFSSLSYFVSRFKFGAFKTELIKVLQKQEFDIIQIEGVFMAVYLSDIRKHSKAKIVLRAHNIEHYIWNRHVLLEKNPIKKAYLTLQNTRLKTFELDVFSKCDAIVTITSTDEAELEKLGCFTPHFTCITGVDIKRYQTPAPVQHKPKTVFYFGSMDWLPNSEAVLWFLNHCWPKIHKAVPDARFVVAGRGMPPSFHKLIAPNLLLVENVPDAAAFYKQHEVMVVPLWSGSGIRIKIIEGMAYGKAIVSTSIGAEGISCTHKKNIIIADNAEDFSKAVIDLLTQPVARMELENKATEFAEQEFDNDKVVFSLIEFYKHLLHA